MKKILCIVPLVLGLAAPAYANDPAPHDEKHEKDKKDKKKDGHGEDEHGKEGKKDEKKPH